MTPMTDAGTSIDGAAAIPENDIAMPSIFQSAEEVSRVARAKPIEVSPPSVDIRNVFITK